MKKTKTQTQMVSKFLTNKQLKSLKVIDGSVKGKQNISGEVVLISEKKNEIYLESNTGGDDFFLIIKRDKNDYISITTGMVGFFTFSEIKTPITLHDGETLLDETLELIINYVNNMTEYLCVSPIVIIK